MNTEHHQESKKKMNTLVYTDLAKVCRGCMGKKGEMQPLYGACLDQMLMEVAEIQVHQGDGLPIHMCVQCVLQVSRAFTFKQQCQRIDTLLRNCVQTATDEKLPLSPTKKITKLNKQEKILEAISDNDTQQQQQQQHQQPVEIQFNDPSNGEKCLFIFQHMPLLNEDGGQAVDGEEINDLENKITNNLENIHDESVTEETFRIETEIMQQTCINDNVAEEFEKYQHNIVVDAAGTFQCDSMISTTESATHVLTNDFDSKILDDVCDDDADKETNQEIVQLFCVECGLEFSTINNLKTHTNLMHHSSTSLISPQSELELLDQKNLQSILNTSTSDDISVAGASTVVRPDCGDGNDKKPQFKCEICEKIFTENKILRRHMKIHSPNKPHVCNICNMSFAESSNLTKHKKKHTGELRNVVGKPNLCSVCGKRFKWASSLSKHMKHHTKHKVLHCPYCTKYYVEARSLSIHIRSHTGEKPFVCDVCEKGFTQMGNLEKHMRVHTGEKPFVCQICGKGFSQSGYVAIHMRTHTGERPYQCKECGKCFAGSNTLAIHNRTHTGERPYQCKVCAKTFARQETAIIHGRTHTGEKPHVCQICHRGFTSAGHLTGHMRSHNGVKPHECTVCCKRFAGRSSLKVHMKSHTIISGNNVTTTTTTNNDDDAQPTTIGCELCDEKFNDYSELEQHEFNHDILHMNDDDHDDSGGGSSTQQQPIHDQHVIQLELDKIIDTDQLIL